MLLLNSLYDALQFLIHSSVFSNGTKRKVEGKLVFYYHRIEKGMINEPLRYKFCTSEIKKMLRLLRIWQERNYDKKNSQFVAACSVLVKYYNMHSDNNIDISEMISESDCSFFYPYCDSRIGGTIEFNDSNYFKHSHSDFETFSNSRHSIRQFNEQLVPTKLIMEVVKIAKNAPSVCNRQSVTIRMINSKVISQKILKIQSGMNATAHTASQLLIVSSNINAFVSEVERNQMYIDGGIFLQNLLYALHHKKIAACCLNWSKHFFYDIKIRRVIPISYAEKIIALVAFGYPPTLVKGTFSERKKVFEIIEVIE